jgi:hypothetical protein
MELLPFKNKFIKLTECYNAPRDIYINIDMIGAMYIESRELRSQKNRTRLQHLTHNNGGYTILETPEQILELIKHANQ